MGMLKNIEWKDRADNTILYKIDLSKDHINRGSALTVREGQAVVFCDKGRMADVFLPGFYKLDTDNIPMLTKLMSWKYGFESPFKSDVYFVNTQQFTNERWGTVNPIMIRDADYGAVRVRGFGTYSFRVDDPYIFLKEIVGSKAMFKTQDITNYLRSMVVTGISDTIGESKIPILDMAGNLMELGDLVAKKLSQDFKSMGLALVKFNFENFSLPPELEQAMDEATKLGMLGKNMNVYTAKAQADALVLAAKNTGMAGTTMGAGLGLGMGAGLGSMFGNMNNNNNAQPVGNFKPCSACGAKLAEGAKFCPDCGKATGKQCPKCKASVSEGAKFCPDCGCSMAAKCPKCNKDIELGAKFCPDCGSKI